MKKVFSAFLAAAFAAALLAFTLSGLTREVDSLRLRLDESVRDVDRLRGENVARIETRAPRPDFDVRALYRDVLAPSVQVSAKSGVGGGTLLYSREDHSYVITAYHVVQNSAAPPEVRIYDEKGELLDEVEAGLVAHDDTKDLALLKLRTGKRYGTVARLASRETLRAVRVFTPLYAIGCPLGHDPLPTIGEIAALRKEVGGENFWMMTAPTIFGNSGGGVFHRETREMIGVSVMICTYDGVVSTPVPHLGIMVSLETVYDWLDSLQYRFIYDAAYTLEACERLREERAPTYAGPPGSPGDR